MTELNRTVLYDRHVALGATMVDFGGWEMPLEYQTGMIGEHLATRKEAGLFDVSHMGRFVFGGPGAAKFLQHVLTNNAEALEPGESQYTLIADQEGGAVDDAYLYRFEEDEYLLVVNASNREIDWEHLETRKEAFSGVTMADKTEEIAMLSLQGPKSKAILAGIVGETALPEPMRNYLSIAEFNGTRLPVGRTGYTGEPLCFELFVQRDQAVALWDALMEKGAQPVGLGARDTLRLEAALPLYGHELGLDKDGKKIPVFASTLAKFAVSFSPLKGEFIGKRPLKKQFEAFKKIVDRKPGFSSDLPRLVMPVLVTGRGIARAGCDVFKKDRNVGYVTSGTMVPYWKFEGEGVKSRVTEEKGRRAICLALLDGDIREGDEVEVDIRGKRVAAIVVPYHLRSEAPPYARPILEYRPGGSVSADHDKDEMAAKARKLVSDAIANHKWRQRECINLIPSEQTLSALCKALSIMDPMHRYAEHKQVKAFEEAEVFYYQGTDFIARVEELLAEEFRKYLECSLVEVRPVSGQMANAAFFSAMVDFVNRADRKSEQRKLRHVINNHIIKGGHLSAQPLGALRDYVMRDPRTEKPAVVNFPVLADNPFKIDVMASRDIIERYKPELIILGKSMTIHKEPVAEMRAILEAVSPDTILMYDMAHVMGLVGPYFQRPFQEGAHIVTGSTHKTYFGTQRGVVAANYEEKTLGYELWEAVQRRAFPGSVSNHHLGTLLGLLMAAYEMNAFKDEYQKAVIENANAFAKALKDAGMDVAGDPDISYTETHQVILNAGYAKGPKIARRLEKNNIVVNFQAGPLEEGFTASGFIRMGVSEMTRFGMGPEDFRKLAQLIRDVVVDAKNVKEETVSLRSRFLEMKYCFSDAEFDSLVDDLFGLLR